MDQVIVGVDIGGTNTVIGLFNRDLTLLSKKNVSSSELSIKKPERFIQLLASEIQRFAENSGMIISAVGLAVPGQVNRPAGVVELATNLEWKNVKLASSLMKIMQVPVTIEHDVRSYTIGEMMKGAGQGHTNLVCLAIGTGMSVGAVVNGELIAGAHFLAGELGHDTVSGLDRRCPCGKIGCLETVVSAPGIARLANEAVSSGAPTILQKLSHPLTAYDVYEACLQGDQVATDIFNYVGEMLGKKLATVIYLLNPEVIIIGGGVAAAGNVLLEPVKETVEKECPYYIEKLQIKIGELGDRAGLIGAAYLAKKQMERQG